MNGIQGLHDITAKLLKVLQRKATFNQKDALGSEQRTTSAIEIEMTSDHAQNGPTTGHCDLAFAVEVR